MEKTRADVNGLNGSGAQLVGGRAVGKMADPSDKMSQKTDSRASHAKGLRQGR